MLRYATLRWNKAFWLVCEIAIVLGIANQSALLVNLSKFGKERTDYRQLCRWQPAYGSHWRYRCNLKVRCLKYLFQFISHSTTLLHSLSFAHSLNEYLNLALDIKIVRQPVSHLRHKSPLSIWNFYVSSKSFFLCVKTFSDNCEDSCVELCGKLERDKINRYFMSSCISTVWKIAFQVYANPGLLGRYLGICLFPLM